MTENRYSTNFQHRMIDTRKGRKGKIIVEVICTKATKRIGVVRVMPLYGPVLWYRGGPASDFPERTLALMDEPKALSFKPGFSVWCPTCGGTYPFDIAAYDSAIDAGLHPLDLAALRSLAKRAGMSPTPLKLSV
jgi:hypothetical protein